MNTVSVNTLPKKFRIQKTTTNGKGVTARFLSLVLTTLLVFTLTLWGRRPRHNNFGFSTELHNDSKG